MKWQKFVLTDNYLKLTNSGRSPTLPDISIFPQYLKGENIFFVSNLTLKELNKPIVIHWGDKVLLQEDTHAEERKISSIENIKIEFDLKGFVMIHPITFRELEKIYNMLKMDNIYYIDDERRIVDQLFTLSQVSDEFMYPSE